MLLNDAALRIREEETFSADQALRETVSSFELLKRSDIEIFYPATRQGYMGRSELNDFEFLRRTSDQVAAES